MLKVRDLVVAYGGIEALKGISIDVPDGQIVTLMNLWLFNNYERPM